MSVGFRKTRRVRARRRRREAPRTLKFEHLEERQLLAGISGPVAGQWASALGPDVPPGDVANMAVGRMATFDWRAEENLLSEVGQGLDGVVKLLISEKVEKDRQIAEEPWKCTGSLLEGGRYVLTAAHCLTGKAEEVTVVFELPGQTFRMGPISDGFHVHPDWDDRGDDGNDIALIELPFEAPRQAERYDIYRGSSEIGKYGLKVGYGNPGTGDAGEVKGNPIKRFGWNEYDTTGYADLPWLQDKALFYDFDSGKVENNVFGSAFGLGKFEVNSAHGDSGGPTFIDGQIAGVTSWGIGRGATDVNDKTDSSFGEISIDTRVSAFADWIDGIIGTRVMDDENAGFSTSGIWGIAHDAQDRGLNGNYRQLPGQSGTAVWSFSDLSNGWYQVSANTLTGRDHSHRAKYVIGSGKDTVTAYVDQRVGRDGWRELGLIEVVDGTLDVTLSHADKGMLVADAIRIVPVEDYHVIDDGDPGFSQKGWWSQSGLKGYHDDSLFSRYGAAEYEFTQIAGGWYEVAVNTPAHSSSTERARYTITSSSGTIYAALDQRSGTGGWTVLDTINVPEEDKWLHVGLGQAGRGYLRADAVRIHRIAKPLLWTVDDGGEGFSSAGSWKRSGLSGFDGDSQYSYDRKASATYHFDGLTHGWYQVFTNTPGHQYSTNQAIYTLSGGGQTVITGLNQQPGTNGWKELDSVEVSGGSLDVVVTQSGQGALRADAIRISPTAPPTSQAIPVVPPTSQTVRTAAPASQVIDDGDAGFEKSGYWMTSGLRGYDGDSLYTVNGSATYAFAELAPGWYRVSVNTPGHRKYSTDEATYTVTSADEKQVVTVDQRTATNGWQELTVIAVPGTDLEVKVTQGDRNILRTDAVRVERISEFYEPYELALKEYLDEYLGDGASRAASLPAAFDVAEPRSAAFLDGRVQTQFWEARQIAQFTILGSSPETPRTLREMSRQPVAHGGAKTHTPSVWSVTRPFGSSARRLHRAAMPARLAAIDTVLAQIGDWDSKALEVSVRPLSETLRSPNR